MVPSAYVHIPFCDSICAYCDFVRIQKNEQFFSSWKEKLIQEIQEYKISSLHTLYFGGGTPSLLSISEFASIRNCFPKDIDEFTVECNPESLFLYKIRDFYLPEHLYHIHIYLLNSLELRHIFETLSFTPSNNKD